MRKFTTHIYTKANYLLNRGRMALSNQRGDFYISDAVKIIIAVVLGALLRRRLSADLSVRPDSAEAEWRSSRPRRMLCHSGVPLVPDCL